MNPQQIKSKLAEYNITPSKSKGQNFLLDEQVVEEMASGVQKNDIILEIGPGLGVLTKALALKARKVILVELDRQIITLLKKEILPKHENVELIEGDVLSSRIYHQLKDSLEHKNYKLIANLPYQITSKAIRQFLDNDPKPSEIIVMVQKEVAERMTAKPGKTSLLSLAVQTESEAEIIKNVPAKSFFPSPKVNSAVVKCDLTRGHVKYQALNEAEKKKFWQLAKVGFSSRRKQLKNNLKSLLSEEEISKFFAKANIKANARAQELSIDQWIALL